MKALLGLIAILSLQVNAEQTVTECKREPVRIAIIDTGIGFTEESYEAKLCDTGHRDFSTTQKFSTHYKTKDKVPQDLHAHGTNIAGIIASHMGDVDYCLIIIKYWDEKMLSTDTLLGSQQAFASIVGLKPDIVNYSGGGDGWDATEYRLIKQYLDNGGKFVAAAGNESVDLDLPGRTYYPALYDTRITVVGNASVAKISKNKRSLYTEESLVHVNGDEKEVIRLAAKSSNFGLKKVTRWEFGQSIQGYGIEMSGSSQATAQATGKIARQIKKACVQ